ncbi:MAG TPA: GlsB/YeaQ/YmgE family stress response membrane protein [Candidatus Acidoferrales bacterium]|nr:GlsB/YeaQ/YmgE family stress response membrane protein [Candidatus Acidoferrales bacterium]
MFSLLWMILIGILAGFLAGHVVKGRGFGLLMDLVIGILGSVLGGWLFSLVRLVSYGLIGRLFTSFVGAVVLLLIVRAIKRA